MNAQQKAPVAGYAQNWGTKQVTVDEMAGPALYAAGGQTVLASDIGWGGFDLFTVPMLSYSGTYYCRVQPLTVDAAPSAQKPCLRSVKVSWYVLATGVEVADNVVLTTEIVRFFAISI